MKKYLIPILGILIWIILLFSSISTTAQPSSLAEYKTKDMKLKKTFMWTLGGWAAANITGGLILRSQSSGSQRYFHEMNAIWNTVNLGIALPGILSKKEIQSKNLDRIEALKDQHAIERILMLNIGLNTGYIATGAFLVERSNRLDTKIAPERLKGYGQSLMLQGGFLLIFDVIQYITYHRNGKNAKDALWSSLKINSNGLSFTYRF